MTLFEPSQFFPNTLAVISGGGTLPQQLAEAYAAQGGKPFIVAFAGQTDQGWVEEFDHEWHKLGSLKSILASLQDRHIKHLVMAGTIKRPSWQELKLDWLGLKLLMQLKLWNAGDDHVLKALIYKLQDYDLEVLSVNTILPSLLTPQGFLTYAKPTSFDIQDIKRGIEVGRAIAAADIGQSVIIQQGLVIGVEAIEGTAALIARCKSIKRTGSGGVLVKLCKPHQETRVDLPTVGPETIKQLHDAGFIGLALEAHKSLILHQKQVIQLANDYGLFIIGIEPEPFLLTRGEEYD